MKKNDKNTCQQSINEARMRYRRWTDITVESVVALNCVKVLKNKEKLYVAKFLKKHKNTKILIKKYKKLS